MSHYPRYSASAANCVLFQLWCGARCGPWGVPLGRVGRGPELQAGEGPLPCCHHLRYSERTDHTGGWSEGAWVACWASCSAASHCSSAASHRSCCSRCAPNARSSSSDAAASCCGGCHCIHKAFSAACADFDSGEGGRYIDR